MKHIKIGLAILLAGFPLLHIAPQSAFAASPGSVVINEVAWAGSVDNSNDEWLELYNPTNNAIDLTGWYFEDDGTVLDAFGSIQIASKSYLLVEKAEDAVSTQPADAILPLSFANTGDSLVLKDDTGTIIDAVNTAGSAWFAGDNTSKATMERIDPMEDGDNESNWADNEGSSGDIASGGSSILGTPGTMNSVANFATTGIELHANTPSAGQEWTVSVDVEDATDVFSYGIEMSYDTSQLQLLSVTQDNYLSENGSVPTSFHHGIGDTGTIIVGEARTQTNKTTVSGNGTLFTVAFSVIGTDQESGVLNILGSSFLGSTNGDIATSFADLPYTIGGGSQSTDTVKNLSATEGTARYSIDLTWDAPDNGADSYNVYRVNPHGVAELLDSTTDTTFTDDDSRSVGGNIVPLVDYSYEVTAILSGDESDAVSTSIQETRGVRGDNNRSDRVDGRDLERLALHFTESDGDASFDPLIDTSYDGYIDGDDLIHIGSNWAITYHE